MKLNDALFGLFFLLLGVVILVHVQSFSKIPGQQVGPALFPGLIAVGLAVCGLLLIVKGWSRRGDGAWFVWEPWTRSPRHVAAFLILFGVNVAYIVGVTSIGFIPLGIIYLVALFWVLRVKPVWIVPIALIMTLAVHYAFYKLLRVPLPWGLLQGIAW